MSRILLYHHSVPIPMQAVRYHAPGEDFRLEDIPRPEPARREVLIRIQASGMCHTELHFKTGLLNLGVAPVVMGHEPVGVIEETGAGVDARRTGERAIVYYYAGCGECPHCRVGNENICRDFEAEFGFISDGGYAEYITVPARNAVPLPDSISSVQAAPIGCSVTTALHATRRGRLSPGEWAVVYGVGAVGFSLIQVARWQGARVIGVGRTEEKLTKARQLGAHHVIDATTETVADQVAELTGSGGADVAFDCVGSEATLEAAPNTLGRRGRLVLIGYTEDVFSVHPLDPIVFEKEVIGSVGATLPELHESVELVRRGLVETVVDRTLPLDQFQEGIEAMDEGALVGKAILQPSPSA